MRIAFISPFYPYRGGIAQFSDFLLLELMKDNEVEAISFKRLYPSLLHPGTSQYILRQDIDRQVRADKLLDVINPLTYFAAAKKISNFNPELVIMSYWLPYLSPCLSIIASRLRKKNLKVISIFHNVVPHENRLGDKFLTRMFLRKIDGAVVLNENSKADLVRLNNRVKFISGFHPIYDFYGKKIDSVSARGSLSIRLDKKVILFFGLIRDYKGLDLLIEAMKELSDEYVLLIAGEVYGSFEKYQKIIDEHRLQARILLHTKYIPDKEVPLYFSAADVCILPYRTATQSGITGMAYHFELPLIVSNAGGLSEVVREDLTGIVLTELSPTGISKAIQEFFDKDLRTAFQENMRKFKAKYSWESLGQAILEFY